MGVHADAVEEVAGDGPVVLTCEHASVRLPSPWRWHPADRWVVGTHWSWDPGAAWLTRGLASRLGARAVLSQYTRLLVDPNRELDSVTLVRRMAEGRLLRLNSRMTRGELGRRLEQLYHPFHAAVDAAMVGSPAASALVSVHSFTPVFNGVRREVEIGVLYDRDEALALALHGFLRERGWDARLNEPYSGAHGQMYSAHSHAVEHGRRAVELEVRQDLAAGREARERVLDDLEAGLRAVL